MDWYLCQNLINSKCSGPGQRSPRAAAMALAPSLCSALAPYLGSVAPIKAGGTGLSPYKGKYPIATG
jgi:hypothetical protein